VLYAPGFSLARKINLEPVQVSTQRRQFLCRCYWHAGPCDEARWLGRDPVRQCDGLDMRKEVNGFVAQEMQPQQVLDRALVLPLFVCILFRNTVPQRSNALLFGGFCALLISARTSASGLGRSPRQPGSSMAATRPSNPISKHRRFMPSMVAYPVFGPMG